MLYNYSRGETAMGTDINLCVEIKGRNDNQ